MHTQTKTDQKSSQAQSFSGMFQPEDKQHETNNEWPRPHLPIQRYATKSVAPKTVSPIVHDVLRSPCQQPRLATLAFVTLFFWRDFNKKRCIGGTCL
jgi:hypothetical protein